MSGRHFKISQRAAVLSLIILFLFALCYRTRGAEPSAAGALESTSNGTTNLAPRLGLTAPPAAKEETALPEVTSTNTSAATPHAEDNLALRRSRNLFGDLPITKPPPVPPPSQAPQKLLELALEQKKAKQTDAAEKSFIKLLESPGVSDELRKTALLELAVMAQERQDLPRAQQIYAQYVNQYPGDAGVPEVLLRQGLLCREMGAPVLALSKFYSVMSSALSLKQDRLEYYQGLVLRAQSEIAETYYLQGKYDDAIEYFGRLLKLDSPKLNKAQITLKLIRSLAARDRSEDVIAQANLFLSRYADSEPAAEVRFMLAQELKKKGRNKEAMEAVLALLQSQAPATNHDAQSWTYWRQRTGNQIANQLYQEGDYFNALQVYIGLAGLSNAADWQVPVLYQAALVYERLQQPQRAAEIYERIAKSRPPANAPPLSPSLVAVLDMAKWRKDFLGWQQRADESNQQITSELTPASTP